MAIVPAWAAIAVGACSSDVTNNQSGSTSGAGGQGSTSTAQSSSSSVSSTASSTASSSSSTAASSSSSGGGDACQMACAHVQMCVGVDPCSFMMFDCSVPANMCVAQCISATPCANINLQTFQACQAQCSGDGGAVDGGQSDGGMAQQCLNCGQSKCIAQAAPCFQDATCGQWLQCVQGCANQANPPPTCATDCDTQYAGAAQLYKPVYACLCTNCMSECTTLDPCNH